MGKRTFFRNEDIKRKRRERRAANGYVAKAHQDEDSVRKRHERTEETKNLHKEKVADYQEFVIEEGYESPGYRIKPGCLAPSIIVIKDFIRSYVRTVKGTGRLSQKKTATVRTATAYAEQFFGGFEEATGSKIVPDDRSEIYSWIKKTLTEEGEVEDIKKQKFNFDRNDFTDLVASMWTRDCPIFMHGLLKVSILFALQVFLFTGARIGAFIPESKRKSQRGLRYRHIQLVLFRSPNRDEPWKIGWRVNQQWLKKNRNENYTVFGIGIRDDSRPHFASGLLLLVIALAHGAISGINSLADFAQFDLRDGRTTEIPLSWNPDALNKPVFRNVTAKGPQEVALNKERFCTLLRSLLTAAGYSKHATIHDIRRALGKKIEARHGSAPVSQIYAHRSESTYPEHYQAHCSSIDTVGDVLDEEEETYHIEYFQSYRQFREFGLPCELPAEMEVAIIKMPEIVEARDRIEQLLENADHFGAAEEEREYRKLYNRIRLSELHRFQHEWVQERRQRRVLNRGKDEPDWPEGNTRTRALALIMPELDHLGATLSIPKQLPFDERLLFAEQLLTQCRRDYDVIYLPGEAPTDDGKCPVHDCRKDLQSPTLKRSGRSAHIHDCTRRDKARRLHIGESDLRYCYECMTWCPQVEWRDHCSYHLQSWSDLHCEVVICRYTVVRPGYCPCCVWNQGLPADERLKYWTCSANLRKHLEHRHIVEIEWPTTDPICGCPQSFASEQEFRYHLHDVHGLTDGIWKSRKPILKRKRDVKAGVGCVEEKAHGPKPKKIQFRHYQPHQPPQIGYSYEPPMPTLTHAPTSKPSLSVSREYACPSSISSRNVASSLVSEDGNTDFSAPSSPLSSLRTTPDLELIDPRILDPIRPKDDCLQSIDGICPAACTENGVPRTGSEELRNEPVVIQPVRHTDFHEVLSKVSHTTAESTSANIPAVCPSTHLSDPGIGAGDEPPDRQEGSVLGSLFAKVSLQTSSSKGPVTRSKARATLSEVAHSNPRERLHQTMKGQSSRRNQATSHSPRKQSLRQIGEGTCQSSPRRITRSQAKRK